MSTFALIHGAGDVGWYWHLVEAELRGGGHDVIAPDLPADDESATLIDYADTVVEARSAAAKTGRRRPVVRGVHRTPGRRSARRRCPGPGSRHDPGPRRVAGRLVGQHGLQQRRTGGSSPRWRPDRQPGPVRQLLQRRTPGAGRGGHEQGTGPPFAGTSAAPWPLDAWPDVPTKFVLCTEDRFFPPDFYRRLVAERLGIEPVEITAGHCVALSRPKELADLLESYGGYGSVKRSAAAHRESDVVC